MEQHGIATGGLNLNKYFLAKNLTTTYTKIFLQQHKAQLNFEKAVGYNPLCSLHLNGQV